MVLRTHLMSAYLTVTTVSHSLGVFPSVSHETLTFLLWMGSGMTYPVVPSTHPKPFGPLVISHSSYVGPLRTLTLVPSSPQKIFGSSSYRVLVLHSLAYRKDPWRPLSQVKHESPSPPSTVLCRVPVRESLKLKYDFGPPEVTTQKEDSHLY